MRKPYLYTGLEATLYDELDELAEFEDASFYRWIIENNPGPILDVGCGTGRLLIPLAKEGLDIEGLDTSGEMISLCERKLSRENLSNCLHLADMRDFQLDRKYQVVMIPGFTIQLLTDERDAIRCLESCRKHLSTGGVLIVCSYIPWYMIYDERNEIPFEVAKSIENEPKGVTIQSSQSWKLDNDNDLLTLRNRYEILDLESGKKRKSETSEMTLKWRLPYDFEKLIRRAGFRNVSLYGDFAFDEIDSEAESIVCVCEA